MRIIFSSFIFVLSLIVGSIAFVATFFYFPAIWNDLIDLGKELPATLQKVGISQDYIRWVNILVSGEKMVLLGFVLATRIVFALLGTVIGPLFGVGSPRARDRSEFHNWG